MKIMRLEPSAAAILVVATLATTGPAAAQRMAGSAGAAGRNLYDHGLACY